MWQSSQGYQMWACEQCNCHGIAASLAVCPQCGKDRPVPKITAGGGPSNADAAPGEPGYVAPDEKPAKPAKAASGKQGTKQAAASKPAHKPEHAGKPED